MRNPNIIFIDDEAEVRDTLERIINDEFGENYRVRVVDSGEQALKLLDILARKEEEVAAVIADHNLGKGVLDGVQTITNVSEKYPFIQTALLTAYGNVAEIVKRAIKEAHVDEFMDKPIDPPEETIFPYLQRMLTKYELSKQQSELFNKQMNDSKIDLKAQMQLKKNLRFGDLWAFYIKTNFIYNSKHEALEPYMNEINETWRNLLTSNDDLSRIVLRYRKGRPRNSLSLIKFYPNTWIVQHMVSRMDPLGMAAVLLDSVEWMINKEGLDYVKFYWRPNNPQTNMLFGGLSESLGELESEVHSYKTFDYHIFNLNEFLTKLSSLGDEISSCIAEPDMFPEISKLLKSIHGPFIYKTDAFDPNTLELSELSKIFQKYNLQRERTVFVALNKHRIVGVGTLEFSSLGLNMSYYFNTFNIHIERQIPPELKRVIIYKLLRKIASYYGRKGRRFIVTMNNSIEINEYRELGFIPNKRYCSISLSKAGGGLEKSYEHVEEFYKSRVKKRIGKLPK